MTPHDGFLRAIAAEPYDDTHRLVYADWLEDHGDAARAELIRVQCELEPIRDRYELPRAKELHKREEQLLGEHQKAWLGAMPQNWDDPYPGAASVEFRRGLPDILELPARTFLRVGPAIL